MQVGEYFVPRSYQVMQLMPTLIQVKALRDGKVCYAVSGGKTIWANESDFNRLFAKVKKTGDNEFVVL